MNTLEAFVVETDLTLVLLLGASAVDWDSDPSDEGKSGVPGGVRSLMTNSLLGREREIEKNFQTLESQLREHCNTLPINLVKKLFDH